MSVTPILALGTPPPLGRCPVADCGGNLFAEPNLDSKKTEYVCLLCQRVAKVGRKPLELGRVHRGKLPK